jgi:hypothetical protein
MLLKDTQVPLVSISKAVSVVARVGRTFSNSHRVSPRIVLSRALNNEGVTLSARIFRKYEVTHSLENTAKPSEEEGRCPDRGVKVRSPDLHLYGIEN